MLLIILALAGLSISIAQPHIPGSEPRRLSNALARNSILSPLRLTFSSFIGHFSHIEDSQLHDIVGSVSEFYSSALKIQPLIDLLHPSVDSCEGLPLPIEDLTQGIETDVHIYLSSLNDPAFDVKSSVCSRDGGTYARPLIGLIELKSDFFTLQQSKQISMLIRESGRILAFSESNFKEFVKPDGSKYSESQHMTLINYPHRGKTVRAIGFPKMLEKARNAFNCSIEGLELEDFFETQKHGFYWDSRTMPHDIMSSYLNDELVFSDITLALFEDSGWYQVEYSYSSSIYWGKNAGCKWFENKCISNEKAVLPGFCDTSTVTRSCDAFNLGYGDCLMSHSNNILPHEEYFNDITLSGDALFDNCPIVKISEYSNCRDFVTIPDISIGESRSAKSRCFMSSLVLKSVNDRKVDMKGGCYKVSNCGSKSIAITIGAVTVDCPYGSRVAVQGYEGEVQCPESSEFCSNLPCLKMCLGRGKCFNGVCECNAGYGGEDCSVQCHGSCKNCDALSLICTSCYDGYYLSGYICVKCNNLCHTCSEDPGKCTSCNEGYQLTDNQCKSNCIDHCSTCDDPCSACDFGYFLSYNACIECNQGCTVCSESAKNCSECAKGYILVNKTCIPDCISGCSTCDRPCSSCNPGFLLSSGLCEYCDNLCKTCENSTKTCTSCFSGFHLEDSTCVSGCHENCLSCDSPCTLCEAGYLSIKGICEKCDNNCLTCESSLSLCTSCHEGFALDKGVCKSTCVDRCLTCDYPCEKCEDGYIAEYGLCEPCDETCATCKGSAIECESCSNGFALIMKSCVPGCTDHCETCDSPCSVCENGYFISGGLCNKCDDSCLICTHSAKECIKCAPGFILSGSVCILGCNEHCLSCDEPCSNCEDGYYSYRLSCSPCQSNCKTCSISSNNCTSCFDKYGLVASRCQPRCSDHCSSCDMPCSSCEPGYFALGSIGCIKCMHPCELCNNANNCMKCAEGYKLEAQVCTKVCVENCVTCDQPCYECKEGYVAVNGTCKACTPHCSMCSEDLLCYYCEDGYEVKGSSCVKICDANCKSCDYPCSECDLGFTPFLGVCTQCESPCLTCSESPMNCVTCPDKHFLSGPTCIPECLENCHSCNNPCTVCDDGYVSVLGSCLKCSEECKTCTQYPENCSSCLEGEVLFDNRCQPKCVDNCSTCDVPCRVCEKKFALSGEKCLPCKSYLMSEDTFAKFSDDLTMISVYFNAPIRNASNICESYIKAESLEKLGSGLKCYWETEFTLNVLLGDSPDYSIKSIEFYPIESENDFCVLEPAKLSAKLVGLSIPEPIISLVLPNYFSLTCNDGFLTAQGITEEQTFGFLINSAPSYSSTKTLTIPTDLLKESILNITFYATNKLKRTSYTSKSIRIINSNPIPSVSIDSGNYIRTQPSKNYTIRGQLSENPCIHISDLKFRWRYIEIHSGFMMNADNILKQSSLSHMLVIRSGQLSAGQSYVFRFEAYSDKVYAFSDIEIETTESDLVLILNRTGGSFNYKEPLVISAAKSYDPDNPGASLAYTWECRDGSYACKDQTGQPVISFESEEVLRIGAYRFHNNVTIELVVKVFRGERSTQKSLFFTSCDSEMYISIESMPGLVNPHTELAVFPRFMYGEGSPQFLWTQIFGPVAQASSLRTSEILVIPAKELLQSHGYTFQISMTINNKTVDTEISWDTNIGPICNSLASKLYQNTVIFSIDCFEKNLVNLPLKYEYGVIIKGELAPMKISNSASFILRLDPGVWNIYVQVCDTLNTCSKHDNLVEIKARQLESASSDFNTQKMFPDYLPVAIWNNAETFTASNFVGAFNDLVAYIRAQDIDKVHLTMALMSLEILTASNKSHFMWNHQEEILIFLTEIVEKIASIDDEDMEDFVNMISEHRVKNYDVTTRAISVFSEKWMTNAPPDKQKKVSSIIQVLRNRIVGKDLNLGYNIGNIFVKSLNMPFSDTEIYDILTIVYPEKPSEILQIQIFKVGDFIKHSVAYHRQILITSDPISPISIEFSTLKPMDYDCLQYLHSTWVEEGCHSFSIGKKSTISIWHLRPFRLVASGLFTIGYQALSCLCIMLGICILSVSLFCALDKSKSNYIQAPFYSEVKQIESPRSISEEQKSSESPEAKDQNRIFRQDTNPVSSIESRNIDDSPDSPVSKFTFENKIETISPTPTSSVEVTLPNISYVLYHPSLNLLVSQNGDRRAASILHLSAVIFMEFLCIGALVNYNWGHIYNDEGKFVWFSSRQVVVFAGGMIVTQLVSFFLMVLNGVNDLNVTKKYIGMGLSSLIIASCSGIAAALTINYPSRYNLLWIGIFAVTSILELFVCQNVLWGINILVFRKRKVFESVSSLHVFTTES